MTLSDISGIFLTYLNEIAKYLGVVVSIIIVAVVALIIRSIMRKNLKPKIALHIYAIIEKIVVYGIIVLGVIASLSPLGIDLTGLIIAGGIIGIVIGFATQTTISNLISGLFLFIDKPLMVGDPVSIGDIGGQVVDIDIFSTKIRVWDGYVVRVPNDKVFNSMISNYAKTAARRIVFKIGISYGSDIKKAKEAIMRAFNEHPFVLVNPAPDIFVDEFGNSAIILVARCWAPSQLWFPTKMVLLEKIYEELKKEGIEIPYPQLDLHVKDKVEVILSEEKSK